MVFTTLLLAATAATTPTPLLRPGTEALQLRQLEPFHARYQDVVTSDGNEQVARKRAVSLEPATYPAGAGLRRTVAMIGGDDTVYDEVHLMRDSLSPVVRSVSALSMVHKVEVFAADGLVRGFSLGGDGTGGAPTELSMEGRRFDGGSVGLILAALPLSTGFSADLATFSSDMGPQLANLTTRVEVTGREPIDLGGRRWNAWVVDAQVVGASGAPLELPNGQAMPKARYWIADEPPYEIRTQWGEAHRVDLTAVVSTE